MDILPTAEHAFYMGIGLLPTIGYALYKGVPAVSSKVKGWWQSGEVALKDKVASLESDVKARVTALEADVAAIKQKLP